MKAIFGKTRFQVQLDLGFGDLIEPIRMPFHVIKDRDNQLFEGALELVCYPKEFILCRKVGDNCLPRGRKQPDERFP